MAKPTRYTEELITEYCTICEPKTLPELWDQNAEKYPDREAIVDSRTRLSWSHAKKWIDRLSLGLVELGIKKDEVVVLQLPSSVELPLLRLACEKAGILSLALLPGFRKKELQYALSFTGAVGIVIPWKFKGFDCFELIKKLQPELPRLKHIFVIGDDIPNDAISIKEMVQRRLEERYPSDYLAKRSYKGPEVSYINLTSGSTGFPKFVEYPAWARPTLGRGLAERTKLSTDDIIGIFTPAVGGPTTLGYYAAPHVGCKIVMLESFDAEEALSLTERERITIATGVDTVLVKMFRHQKWSHYDVSSVRLWYMGGPAINSVAEEVEDRGGVILNIYGAADFGGMSLADITEPRSTRLMTLGKPVAGATLKIVNSDGNETSKGETGEIWGTGPSCASGYYQDSESTWQVWTKDGWFRTGDLGRFDEQGNLLLVGRIKDMIKRGGQNIYPAEIEQILMDHPKVAAVAIVSMPDPVLTEKACAYVVCKTGEGFTFDEMTSFLRSKDIAMYKMPERLEILEEMPMVAEGQKVDKKVLRKDLIKKLLF